MTATANEVKLVLIADRANRTTLLHNTLAQVGIRADIRTLAAGDAAINCVRQRGTYRRNLQPDLFFFDFSYPSEHTISVLRSIAFDAARAPVPIIILTSPESQKLLDSGDIDGGDAVMFSPTGLLSFARKMQSGNRTRFFKALRTLYQFGPILVRVPQLILSQDTYDLAATA